MLAHGINDDSSDEVGPSSSSGWESNEEEMEEEGEQSVVEESKQPVEEKKEPPVKVIQISESAAQMQSPAVEDRRQSKEQTKSHEKKKGDGQSLVLESSLEMEFEERKAEEPAHSQMSKNSKSRSGKGSRRR